MLTLTLDLNILLFGSDVIITVWIDLKIFIIRLVVFLKMYTNFHDHQASSFKIKTWIVIFRFFFGCDIIITVWVFSLCSLQSTHTSVRK